MNTIEQIVADPELKDKLQSLVLERVGLMPDDMSIYVGGTQLNKKQMLEHVREGDEVGQQVMETELDYLRAITSGSIYAEQ
jgi:hypothetical protein